MEPNVLREQIFEIIKNQMKIDDPAETNITYNRLRNEGYDDFQTKQMIGQCVAVELFGVFKKGTLFNEERYVNNLKKLPEEPFD